MPLLLSSVWVLHKGDEDRRGDDEVNGEDVDRMGDDDVNVDRSGEEVIVDRNCEGALLDTFEETGV